MHDELRQKSAARIEEAEQTQGHQMFDGAVKYVLSLNCRIELIIYLNIGA